MKLNRAYHRFTKVVLFLLLVSDYNPAQIFFRPNPNTERNRYILIYLRNEFSARQKTTRVILQRI